MSSELPDASKIKLIVTDLDGTLLYDKDEISERTKTVIHKVLEKYPDIHFVIATGRTRPGTKSIREALNLKNRPNIESIFSNGCVIYDYKGELLWQSSLPIEYISKFHKLLNSFPNAVYFYTDCNGMITFEEFWAEKAHEILHEEIFIKDKEEHIKKVESGESKINKVTYVAAGIGIDYIIQIKNQLEELAKEYNLEKAEYSPLIVEYMPKQTNKGTCLAQLMKNLNISKEEVIGFGDGANDIELLQNVGWPIAMENASDKLKPYAKYIAKSNSEDGVAELLEKIFLKEEQMN